MGFFNKVGHQISKGVSALEERNHRQAQLNRIRSVLRRDEAAAQIEYAALGKYYYENLRDPGSDAAEVYCNELDRIEMRMSASVKQLELCYAEIAAAKKKSISEDEDEDCVDASKAADAVKAAAAQVGERMKRVASSTHETVKETAAEVEERVLRVVEEAAHTVSEKAGHVAEAAAERRSIQPDEGLNDDSEPDEEPAFASGDEKFNSFAADEHENDNLPFAD